MAGGEGESAAGDLRDYARTAWRQRWLIFATVVIALGVAVVASLLETSVYEATSEVIIQPSRTEQILNPPNQNASVAARNVHTETAVLQSTAVEDAAKKKLGHKPDVAISSDSAHSDVVSINARSTNARRAAADANGYADAYLTLGRTQMIDELTQAAAQVQTKIAEFNALLPGLRQGTSELTSTLQQLGFLQQQLEKLQVSASVEQGGGARLLAKADVPTSPAEPKTVRNAAIALALGLLIGLGLAALREYLQKTNRPREDLEGTSTSTG